MYDHGIVCGKFWPLHNGHTHLINTALARSKRVTIFVVHTATQNPSGPVRAEWVRKAFPTANVKLVYDLHTDDTTRDSNILWARYTNEILEGDVVDAVFSSEQYAIGWAECLSGIQNNHVKNVGVDYKRTMHAISGTMIRNDIYAYFHMIHPVARPWYVKRVLIVGGESTGKTTLAIKLAKFYSTRFVPEYGRVYCEQHGIGEFAQKLVFPHIINKQLELEEATVLESNRVVFCDTDLYTTYLWSMVWKQDAALVDELSVLAQQHANRYDLVLVSGHQGTEWVDDGLRDQENNREWFTRQLSVYAETEILAFEHLTGTWEEREHLAIQRVNKLFGTTEAILPQ